MLVLISWGMYDTKTTMPSIVHVYAHGFDYLRGAYKAQSCRFYTAESLVRN